MALSVIKRPVGYHRKATVYYGTFANGSSTVTTPAAESPGTGSIIYISSGPAIGFWYVTNVSSVAFQISEYSTGTVYTFTGTGTLSYYRTESSTGHFWNAVHLPVVFKLKSTLWPTNSVDTARTVSSFANDNGYVKLTLSGALLSSLSELEFVKITGIGEAGVYQIITWYSTSVVTINMPYYSSLSFGPASVQYYYNNYRAKVRLYAGLSSSHTFGAFKPYTLVCEKEIVPDSNGIVAININEDLKAFMSAGILRNDLTTGALPINLDAFTQFYITYAEAYDYSAGGYGLLDFVGSYTSDQSTYEGYAVNADLPFKNVHSGSLSDYVCFGVTKQKFLTPSLYPVHSGQYFDISWVQTFETTFVAIKRELYLNGTLQNTFYDTINNNGIGVYRQRINQYSTEDRIDLTLVQYPTPSLPGLASFTNTGTGTNWTITATPNVAPGAGNNSKLLTSSMALLAGVTYTFKINTSGPAADFVLTIGDIQAQTSLIGSDETISFTPTVSSSSSNITIRLFPATSPGTYTVNSFTLVSVQNLSETKTITVDNSCYSNCVDISWLNYLGGFDYWRFKSLSDYGAEITSTVEQSKNITTNWPQSYGEGADTIRYETSRTSRNTIVLRAENLTADQVNDLYRIRLSPLVQIVNSATDRRTIIPDRSSFTYYQQINKLHTLSFSASYTDDNPSQSL